MHDTGHDGSHGRSLGVNHTCGMQTHNAAEKSYLHAYRIVVGLLMFSNPSQVATLQRLWVADRCDPFHPVCRARSGAHLDTRKRTADAVDALWRRNEG